MEFKIKENNNFKVPMDEVEYLNAIGVRYISGKLLGNLVTKIIVDESQKAYLIRTGMTNPNRDGGDTPIFYYSFCKYGMIFKLEVVKNDTGEVKKRNIVNHWIATIKEVPKEIVWSECKFEICENIKEALSIEAYNSYGKNVGKECFNRVDIDVVCL